ncbi:acetyl-CoA C-acyltransferase [Marinifilum caeruleilacunae]|uniref:acetyl-CoA C-acyltransferase n=1 Tax=Marinifilum caeruleilacunae TaxID=2499076 RepID=A0ABX1WYZ2_9BACT|nr:acetyl-CoA C-acyltransferase [Marinifilum caeruleilacunae]NOU61368.1 acetyl-CoA C-acyltransferase [Marinifilum caeruleilacunae]
MNAYIVAAYRTAVGKAKKGKLRLIRPDDMAARVVQHIMEKTPSLDPLMVDDVIVGNATPEAEQGLNIGRMISLMGLDKIQVPGMTVNRYCSSGLETIAIAASKIEAGLADCILAGGVEMMSLMPMGGWRLVPNLGIAKSKPDYYWNMGITAEALQKKYKISREDQDEFAFHSHRKALEALSVNRFVDEIVPITVSETFVNSKEKAETKEHLVTMDEGPRADTSLEGLSKLRPVFAQNGTVTAGNSSQTSDGAAFVLVVSEKMLKQLNVQPIARFVSYAVAGVEPKHMGIGPVEAIPKVLQRAGMQMSQIEQVELNEAFAVQALSVMRELDMNPDITNVNGGAIALGHPLGCTGTKLSVQLLHEMKKRNQKYGMVTMCVGSGQGAAGIFELL